MLLTLSDAGDGAGTWTVSLAPQAQTHRRRDRRARAPSRSRRAATSRSRSSCARPPTPATGENYGFVVLSGNGVQRRVPYAFLVERPALRNAPAVAAEEAADRRHRSRHEPRVVVLLPVRAVRPAAELHRRAR